MKRTVGRNAKAAQSFKKAATARAKSNQTRGPQVRSSKPGASNPKDMKGRKR